MNATEKDTLSAWETQLAVAMVARRADSLAAATRGVLAAAICLMIRQSGPANTVEWFRDLADTIERDVVLPRGEAVQ